MANLLYSRPSDNVTANATIVASAADASYPASNLGNLRPEKPAKLTTTSGNFVLDFGAAQRVDVVALINHNLQAGLEVRIQANATDSWGAPTFNQVITIPAHHEDGFVVSPFLDLTGLAGYSASGFRFWRLIIVGANDEIVAIGELVLVTTKRSFEINIADGAEEDEGHPLSIIETDVGVRFVYEFGTKLRLLAGELDTTDVGSASLRSLQRSARTAARPFIIVIDPAVNEAWFVTFGDERLKRRLNFIDRNGYQVVFREVSNGLPLRTPPA